ncbi:hypothetical protein glysoja_041375 [Glycine soja]|uniref:RNase H type-1 domain-containing protein n=1 Tax=Glycine soja TaxID=3848 RepID=A0A0B2Q5M0_GLYSO|nr:hypothetical protein glysoja_041375 [Glycine soja]
MKAKTSLHNGNPSPSEVKAWGLYQAIAWIHDLGYHNVIFEVDSKMVTNSFNNKVDALFEFHVILSNCRDKIQNITNSRIRFSATVHLSRHNLDCSSTITGKRLPSTTTKNIVVTH